MIQLIKMQKQAKARRESEIQKTRMRTTMTKMTIKSKTENESRVTPLFLPLTNPNVHPPTTHTAFVIHIYPPSSLCALFMGTESHLTPPPHPCIPQFHCRTLFMYCRVRTLGLVSSFGSVFLIFSVVQPAGHGF
uniref:Transmembrane protein n=1 Tax=Nothobranchius furzeri TaxID=105023 RepID=A0A8C6NLI5_NOTFU